MFVSYNITVMLFPKVVIIFVSYSIVVMLLFPQGCHNVCVI